jgi:hypothetical protein
MRTLAVCASLLIGVACTSGKIHATLVAQPAIGRVDRLYVLVDHSAIQVKKDPSADTLATALHVAFDQQGVHNESRAMAPTQLDAAAYLPQVTAYAPSAVLVVRVTGGEPAEYDRGGYYTLLYEAGLYDPQLGRRLWQAEVSNSGGTAFMRKRFRKMAESIVRQLKRDGMI